jgi:hypothetical protein
MSALGSTEFEQITKDLELLKQVILKEVGSEVRDHWGEGSRFEAHLLQEPYVSSKEVENIAVLVNQRLESHMQDILRAESSNQLLTKYQKDVELVLNLRLRDLIDSSDIGVKALCELLGKAMFCTIQKEKIIGNASKFTFSSTEDNQKAGSIFDAQDVSMGNLYEREHFISDDGGSSKSSSCSDTSTGGSGSGLLGPTEENLDTFLKQLFEASLLLPEEMRSLIWSIQTGMRSHEELPMIGNLTGELNRCSKIRGMTVGDLKKSAKSADMGYFNHILPDMVAKKIGDAFPVAAFKAEEDWTENSLVHIGTSTDATTSPESEKVTQPNSSTENLRLSQASFTEGSSVRGKNPKVFTLRRRVEHLAQASVILTGNLTERSVSIAALLMHVFPLESPVSEKMLRAFSRITKELLPAEILSKQYSLASVSQSAWSLLAERDAALYHHLQQSMEEKSGDNLGLRFIENSRRNGKHHSAKQSTTLPASLMLLKGWLESGFVGWLPQFGLFFLWDQLFLLGANSQNFAEYLPRICCCLLQLLRDNLLECREGFVSVLERSGRALGSARLIDFIRTSKVFSASNF